MKVIKVTYKDGRHFYTESFDFTMIQDDIEQGDEIVLKQVEISKKKYDELQEFEG